MRCITKKKEEEMFIAPYTFIYDKNQRHY